MLKAASRRMEAMMRSAEIIHALLRSSPSHTLALPAPSSTSTITNGDSTALVDIGMHILPYIFPSLLLSVTIVLMI
jgi:hypothetical protein